jgi:pyruvate dehydrogenase E2 component (dihydrolipoamide acetyltransferase)
LPIDRVSQRKADRRIEREDVESTVRELLASANATAAEAALDTAPQDRPARRRKLSGLRRLIAERMAQSVRTVAPVTLTTEADATELVRLREALKADPVAAPAPSYNVLLARLVALALLEHPDLNATLDGGELVNWETVNIGIAVETPRGLVVPVLRDVQGKSLQRLAVEAEDLLARAQVGKALPDELTGSTFTLTNLGMFGVDAFTPIINPPEGAVLGIGRLIRKAAVLADGTIAPRTMLALSLTFDHRLVDGAPAARCLQRISQFVAQPYLWLARAE